VFIVIRGLFLLDAQSTSGPERISQSKVPMTLSGIKLATSRLVAQYLKQLRHLKHKEVYLKNEGSVGVVLQN
jgi:hypothetical protein